MLSLDYKLFPILVVDDEKDNLEAFRMEFEEYFQILTAPSGKEALEILKIHPEVAVVVVDQRMPEMTGVDFFKEVNRLYPEIIRILITAYSDIQVVIEAINSGQIYKYISKPWDHEDVRLSMMRAIENYYLAKDRERLIEEKIGTVKKAAEANRLASLGMLAAGIAHEINNPLVSISTFLGLLPSKFKELSLRNPDIYDQSFWTDFYQLTENEMKRVQDLIHELLNLAKPPKFSFEETKINELIRAESKIFESAAKERDIRFILNLEDRLPSIRCDGNRIKQVLLNLVLNAIQATGKGGEVKVESHPGESHGERRVEIAVVDTGEGISKEIQEKIFQPFFSTKQKGTGLGLVVCDLIVRQHGGEIRVASEVGKGTQFVVALPLEPQPVQAA
ncbi:MAG: response regulator [Chlamydiae bacterium]|nr:response regulator [Chlamydiota bacterium]MBI3276873.1 response regulator [Chlamydiota bacterium]